MWGPSRTQISLPSWCWRASHSVRLRSEPHKPPLVVAAAAQCNAFTKKKKRCWKKAKKGATNGLCSVHQPNKIDLDEISNDGSDDSDRAAEEDVPPPDEPESLTC